MRLFTNATVNALLSVCSLLYLAAVSAAVEVFRCVDGADDSLVLVTGTATFE